MSTRIAPSIIDDDQERIVLPADESGILTEEQALALTREVIEASAPEPRLRK